MCNFSPRAAATRQAAIARSVYGTGAARQGRGSPRTDQVNGRTVRHANAATTKQPVVLCARIIRLIRGRAFTQMNTDRTAPFGTLLRHTRLAAGFTQADLAERTGLSARAISDLERGRHRAPSRRTLASLSAALV